MANAPESDDSSFSWETFRVAVNKDLADTFGNFVNRTVAFTAKRFDGVVPEGGTPGEEEEQLQRELDAALREYTGFLEGMEFRKAMQALRGIWSQGNTYLDRKAPWQTIKTDREATALTMRTALNLVVLFARLSAPVIPDTTDVVCDAVGAGERDWPTAIELELLAPGAPITAPPVLFRKIEESDVDAWRERYGAPSPAPTG